MGSEDVYKRQAAAVAGRIGIVAAVIVGAAADSVAATPRRVAGRIRRILISQAGAVRRIARIAVGHLRLGRAGQGHDRAAADDGSSNHTSQEERRLSLPLLFMILPPSRKTPAERNPVSLLLQSLGRGLSRNDACE